MRSHASEIARDTYRISTLHPESVIEDLALVVAELLGGTER